MSHIFIVTTSILISLVTDFFLLFLSTFILRFISDIYKTMWQFNYYSENNLYTTDSFLCKIGNARKEIFLYQLPHFLSRTDTWILSISSIRVLQSKWRHSGYKIWLRLLDKTNLQSYFRSCHQQGLTCLAFQAELVPASIAKYRNMCLA